MTASTRSFTLIEVVLAMAILGTGLVGLFSAASRCLAVVQRARDTELAQRVLAQGDLDNPLLPGIAVRDIEVRGETYDHGFGYARSVEPVEGEPDLFIVRTTIARDAGGRSLVELARYHFTTNHPDFEPW